MLHERSFLFVPGVRPDRFERAATSGADAIVLDLEDSVLPETKSDARAFIHDWLVNNKAWIRVNSVDSSEFNDDQLLLRSPNIQGIIVPKAELTSNFSALGRYCRTGLPIIPLIETAIGFNQIENIGALRFVSRIAFGSVDFMVDMGIPADIDNSLLYVRSRFVLASRLGNLPPPIDGVTTTLDSFDKLEADLHISKTLGFGGKLCIHPKQISITNQTFSPTAEAIEWAEAVIDAFKASGVGAVKIDGQLIDRPLITKAHHILHSVPK